MVLGGRAAGARVAARAASEGTVAKEAVWAVQATLAVPQAARAVWAGRDKQVVEDWEGVEAGAEAAEEEVVADPAVEGGWAVLTGLAMRAA